MADIALVIYMILVFFAMATIESVQLTLPGIAGIILAIGMAVDANVIIFERINEELQNGKSSYGGSGRLQPGFLCHSRLQYHHDHCSGCAALIFGTAQSAALPIRC